jgi:large subunit ribosomal protein L9
MQVILLERVEKLGAMGQLVRVKDGYARNYLLPQGKALRATEANRERFERDRADLEARNAEQRDAAHSVSGNLDGASFVLLRQAGESGQLYGSVSARDIAGEASALGVAVNRTQVKLEHPIKAIGIHKVRIALHPEVSVTVSINVARSPDEAEAQARGEVLTGPLSEREEARAAAEALFEEEAAIDVGEYEDGDKEEDKQEATAVDEDSQEQTD